jgi:hypothetical protein
MRSIAVVNVPNNLLRRRIEIAQGDLKHARRPARAYRTAVAALEQAFEQPGSDSMP